MTTELVTADKLRVGDIVEVRDPNGVVYRSLFIVEKIQHTPHRHGRGGMDEGSPEKWVAKARMLGKHNDYDPSGFVVEGRYDGWSDKKRLVQFHRLGTMDRYQECGLAAALLHEMGFYHAASFVRGYAE